MKKAYLYAGTAIFCWSTMAVISKILLGSLNNFQLLWASSFFAGAFLLIINSISGKLKILRNYKLTDYFKMSIIGFPGTFLYYVFYYTGADIMPASQAFIINYLWGL